MTSLLVTNIGELTTHGPQGTVQHASLIIDEGRVAWVGAKSHQPPTDARLDVEGRAVVPGFVDSHAHLVFAGSRAVEFAARMAGEPYTGPGDCPWRRARRDPCRDRRDVARQREPLGRRGGPAGYDNHGNQERVRPHRRGRGPVAAHRRAVLAGDHLPRRPRGTRRHRPGRLRPAGLRRDARRRPPAREVGRRVLRARRVRCRPGARRPRRRHAGRPGTAHPRQPADRGRRRAAGGGTAGRQR